MQCNISKEDFEKARPLFKHRMLQVAALRLDSGKDTINLDPRTVTVLQDNGLLDQATPHLLPETFVEAVEDASDARRRGHEHGPLLFICDTESTQTALDVTDMLLDLRRKVRIAATEHFKRMAQVPNPSLITKTRAALNAMSADLAEEDPNRWRRAAVGLWADDNR